MKAPSLPPRMPIAIEALAVRDARAFVEHLCEHLGENGRHGYVYAPIEPRDVGGSPVEIQRRAQAWARCMARSVAQPEWRRAFVIRYSGLDLEGRARRPDRGILAHLDLRGGPLRAELHRCHLAMGIYEPFRGLGWGKALLAHAVAWARQQPSLDWLDLGVFGHNLAAQHLYRQAGFIETGRIADRFRVQGGIVDDIQMTLRLR